jgi:hypothetical protein
MTPVAIIGAILLFRRASPAQEKGPSASVDDQHETWSRSGALVTLRLTQDVYDPIHGMNRRTL